MGKGVDSTGVGVGVGGTGLVVAVAGGDVRDGSGVALAEISVAEGVGVRVLAAVVTFLPLLALLAWLAVRPI